tara:strand:+ start:717 stop:911 length:195 start_codon:yes stop_codon:yes gene_type:complete
MKTIEDYATTTTETLQSLLQLTTTVSDEGNRTREILYRLIETMVNNHFISNEKDIKFILNKKDT